MTNTPSIKNLIPDYEEEPIIGDDAQDDVFKAKARDQKSTAPFADDDYIRELMNSEYLSERSMHDLGMMHFGVGIYTDEKIRVDSELLEFVRKEISDNEKNGVKRISYYTDYRPGE